MRQRCENPNYPRYADWGGRGITVCDAWSNFEQFYADLGPKLDGETLERIDNSKGYFPGNCRWASPADQVRNRRNTRWVTIDEETLCLKDWCRELGVNYQTVFMRIERGMNEIDALLTPVRFK